MFRSTLVLTGISVSGLLDAVCDLSYHAADCQPTAPVRSVSLVQSAAMPYRTI